MTRLTIFKATLIQDSALSVSGLDRENTADHPFTIVDGKPILRGTGLKGAVVALARRFFVDLPRSVSEDPARGTAFRRSAWEFTNATPRQSVLPKLRAGVGIRHRTGARAGGVLYDHEVIPKSTEWALEFRVDWSHAGDDALEVEGILGYVLKEHWTQGRCWLGGSVARGLGWCHITDLKSYRLDAESYDRWIESKRTKLPDELPSVPESAPTKSWYFRTLDVKISFGVHTPQTDGQEWGLDMLAIGPHDSERTMQSCGTGRWVTPSWGDWSLPITNTIETDRSILMDQGTPLLPGSSVRGSVRHSFSRAKNANCVAVQDPHPTQGDLPDTDEGGRIFGTTSTSSRLLIRDGFALGEWFAARLHMHAEDEFSASSYESAKRDSVRILKGDFPVRFVVEGPTEQSVTSLTTEIDYLVELGKLGHLPVGGHKTRGAGWGKWLSGGWQNTYVTGVPRATAHAEKQTADRPKAGSPEIPTRKRHYQWHSIVHSIDSKPVQLEITQGTTQPNQSKEKYGKSPELTLGEIVKLAKEKLGETLVAWWCEPSIDLDLKTPPQVFGTVWPSDASALRVDEVLFGTQKASLHVARTALGTRWVLIKEIEVSETIKEKDTDPNKHSITGTATDIPAHLYANKRFKAAQLESNTILLREWKQGTVQIGFTFVKENANAATTK